MAKKSKIREELDALTDEELMSLVGQVDGQDNPVRETAEIQSKTEISATLQGIKDRTKQEQLRRAAATDSEYWAQIVFGSKAQRDAFFAGLAASHLLEDQWVDGVALAAHLGVELPESPALSSGKPNAAWNEFVG